MASQPTLKRSRTDETVPELSNDPKRSDFWKSDGNIILQAGGMQFLVHRSMLSDHSPVFKDLFALASPGAHSSLEELPVIQLADDPADLSHVLKALYDRNYFHISKPQPLSAISALLQLGDKYDLKVLRQDAIRVLHAGSPLEFSTPPENPLELFPQVLGTLSSGFYIDFANVLHANGIDTLLPIALTMLFYTHKHEGIRVLFRGAERPDGTRALLQPASMEIAVTGYHHLLQLIQRHLYTWAREPIQDCDENTCLQYQIQFLMNVNIIGFVDHVEEVFTSQDGWFDELCEECEGPAREHLTESRKTLWAELPSCFNAEYSWPAFRAKLAEMLA